jgi:hypothetical protein
MNSNRWNDRMREPTRESSRYNRRETSPV